MSRTRQIPVMDITQRERMLHQAHPQNEPSATYNQPPYHPMARPMQSPCRPRAKKSIAAKFRLSDTPSLISNGCSSVRQLCNNVQNITMDLNNLIGSVENMVPLLNTYLAVVQSRNAASEQELEPPIDVTVRDCSTGACTIHEHTPQTQSTKEPMMNDQTAQQTASSAQAQPQQPINNPSSNIPNGSASMTPPMPRPEDIQQLLENPLVRNLLTGFMQNGPFPNTNTMKENAPRQ